KSLAKRPSRTSQQMTANQDGLTMDDTDFPTGPAATGASSRDPAHQLRRQANCKKDFAHAQELQTAITEIAHIDSQGKLSFTSSQIFNTTESCHPASINGPEIPRTQETT